MLPSLFVSHGAPTLPLEENDGARFLRGLADHLPRPRAIVVASAHWTTGAPTVGAAARPSTVHDFGGFPDELYRLRYPAPGDPALADRVVDLLDAAGISAATDPQRGLDHGVWVPLLLAWPGADIPVVPISIQPQLDPAWHHRVGRALSPLRSDDVLVMGSGGLVHNLRQFFTDRTTLPGWARTFEAWLVEAVEAGEEGALLAVRERPDLSLAHPSDEHLLPLYVAMGAGGLPGRAVHRSFAHGALAMDVLEFGDAR